MKQIPIRPAIYVALTASVGVALAAGAFAQWHAGNMLRFVAYLLAAALASRLRVTLPGITGTMSVNFVFTLASIVDLSLPQVLVVTWAGIVGQVVQRRKDWSAVQIVFNLASITVSASTAFAVYHSPLLRLADGNICVLLLACSIALFLTNTLSVSGIIALTEKKRLYMVWRESFSWTASHYLVGAGLAALFHGEEKLLGWEAVLLTAPVIYLVYRSYSLHLSRLEAAKKHATELGNLHWRAIEALALAIDAKDETTHNHLLRVKVYATEVGRELNLTEEEMQALQAAALLHDIGKLAVPEHIIAKPGKLTPDEFEKMKIHPVVGAEILERVRFPYPVVPIVRSHHEKWNGKGYPYGLAGEEIPIGARILSAVDCLDALASDRQYRRALPLDKAMEMVVAESGISFDPKIVEILQRRHVELEQMATSLSAEDEPKLSKNVKFERGEAPASGFENSNGQGAGREKIDFMVSIGAARREFHNLLKLTEELGGSLSPDELLCLLGTRLKRMVPHDTIAVYVLEDHKLIPKYVNGSESACFSGLEIPIGQGVSGWVVDNRSPIINGNPSVEFSYLNDRTRTSKLLSALSVPLEARGERVGALTLYAASADCFTRDHLRILLAISSRAGQAIANALEHERIAASAITDELTLLPNARSLYIHLEGEIKRAEREQKSFALLVIDVNGFKQINDNYGHLAGNRALQRIARELRANCRPVDYVARLGGDEFVVVLPNIDPRSLAHTTRLLNSVIGCGIETSTVLSLSVGAAFYPENGNSAETLLEFADGRMYQKKREYYDSKSGVAVVESPPARGGGVEEKQYASQS